MALYRDATDAIWVDTLSGDVACVVDPQDVSNAEADVIGEPMERDYVSETWGPLVEVRPVGWEDVK